MDGITQGQEGRQLKQEYSLKTDYLFEIWHRQISDIPHSLAKVIWLSTNPEDIFIQDYSDGSCKVIIRDLEI